MVEDKTKLDNETFEDADFDDEFGDIPELPDDGSDTDDWEALAAEAAQTAAAVASFGASVMESIEPDAKSSIEDEGSSRSTKSGSSPKKTSSHASSGGLPKPVILGGLVLLLLNAAGILYLVFDGTEAQGVNEYTPPQISKPIPANITIQPEGQPNFAEMQMGRAKQRFNDGYLDESQRILEDVLSTPDGLNVELRYDIYSLLAETHRKLGRIDEATFYFRKASGELIDALLPSDLFAQARRLREERQPESARVFYYAMLARADELGAEHRYLIPMAELEAVECLKEMAEKAKNATKSELEPFSLKNQKNNIGDTR